MAGDHNLDPPALVVEGRTEELFVRDVLSPFLWAHEIIPDARRVETGKMHGRVYRGGVLRYAHLRRDLTLWMKEDRNPDARFTTMVDLHRLPADFPGYDESRSHSDPIKRAADLERCMAEDIGDARFVPYIQVHEFEALLFADPTRFLRAFPAKRAEVQRLAEIRAAFSSPEHIDDGEETAPSKRIKAVLPEYEKVAAGALIAREIGMDAMLEECRHFADWVRKLASLGPCGA